MSSKRKPTANERTNLLFYIDASISRFDDCRRIVSLSRGELIVVDVFVVVVDDDADTGALDNVVDSSSDSFASISECICRLLAQKTHNITQQTGNSKSKKSDQNRRDVGERRRD